MANCHSSLWPFLRFIVQKIFKKNINFSYHQVKNQKKWSCYVHFESWNETFFHFTVVVTGWYLILTFVWNNFWTNFFKSGHSDLAKNRKILQHEKKSHVCAAIGQFGQNNCVSRLNIYFSSVRQSYQTFFLSQISSEIDFTNNTNMP